MFRSRRISFTLLCTCAVLTVLGCSPAAKNASAIPAFNQDRAYDLLKQQVEIGPRYPNTEAHKRTAELILAQLRPYADAVVEQPFSQAVGSTELKMCNVIAFFNPDAKKSILLAAHWDTRPIADMEVNAVKKAKPIDGANDGASGVAVLLELARLFKEQKPDVGIVMVFFDGEDYGPGPANMFMGSRHFAQDLNKSLTLKGKKVNVEYGILLDMIGDKNLNIYRERNSQQAAPEVVDKIWATAERMGHKDKFIPEMKYSIEDDHIPLIRAGLKTVDIIDFDYAHWHTLDDTIDKVSAQSLGIVGSVVARVIYEEKLVD